MDDNNTTPLKKLKIENDNNQTTNNQLLESFGKKEVDILSKFENDNFIFDYISDNSKPIAERLKELKLINEKLIGDEKEKFDRDFIDGFVEYKINQDEYNILKNFNFKESNLLNMCEIYNFFINYQGESEIIKIYCIAYFINYHQNKFPLYFDINSNSKFISKIFFDSSIKIFNQFNYLHKYMSLKFYKCIIKEIIYNKNFIEWFKYNYENNKELLKYKIKLLKYNCDEYDHYKNGKFYDSKLKMKVILILENLYKFVYDDYNETETNQSTNENNIKNNIQTVNKNIEEDNFESQKSTIIFPDTVIVEILDYLFKYIINNKKGYQIAEFITFSHKKYINIKTDLSNYVMVSKQFFKVISKILHSNQYHYYLNNGSIKFNNNQFNLIKQPQNYFDYLFFKNIPYSISKDKLLLLFSKVETFTFIDDYWIIAMEQTFSGTDGWYYYGHEISYDNITSIERFGYLIFPPPMPNLKEIIFEDLTKTTFSSWEEFLLGKEPKYSMDSHNQYFDYLINNCNNNSIEIFKMNNINAEKYYFQNLLENHSKSLKEITSIFDKPHLLLNFISILKEKDDDQTFQTNNNHIIQINITLWNEETSDCYNQKIQNNNYNKFIININFNKKRK